MRRRLRNHTDGERRTGTPMRRDRRPVVRQSHHGLSVRDVRLLDLMGQKGYATVEVVSGRGKEGGVIRNMGAAELQAARRLERMGLAIIGAMRELVRGGRIYAYYSVEMTPSGRAAWHAHYGT